MKLVVLGLGSIGMRHATNLLELGHEVWGWDPDGSSHALFLIKGGKLTSSPFETPEADGFLICSPTEFHAPQLNTLIDRRVPIFVEKPLGLIRDIPSLTTSLIDCDRYGITVMLGCNLRFNPVVRHIKTWLDERRIGVLKYANLTLSQQNTKYSEHVVTNWGAHEIDLARFWFGAITKVRASGVTPEEAHLALRHYTGVGSYINLDYYGTPHMRCGMIVGTEGLIEYDLEDPFAKLWNKDHHHYPLSVWPSESAPARAVRSCNNFDPDYVHEMRTFAQLCDVKSKVVFENYATGHDGLAVLDTCRIAMWVERIK
jgi:predicted dehydrogenase